MQNVQRVCVFVDVQNMFYSAKMLHQSKVDYGKMLIGLLNGRPLVRAIAYIVQKPDIDQSGFHEALSRFGYEVKVIELRIRESEEGHSTSKGSWSVGLTIDAMKIGTRMDTAIIVSGDGAYVPLVDCLRKDGVRVEVASFERSTAGDLVKAADAFTPIQQDWIFKEKKFENAPVKHHQYEGLPQDEDELEDQQPITASALYK